MRARIICCLLVFATPLLAQQAILPTAQLSGSVLVASRTTPVSVTQDGKELALPPANSGNVNIVDVPSGQRLYELTSTLRPLKALRFLPDDQTLMGVDDCRVCLWNLQKKKVSSYCPPMNADPQVGSLIDYAISLDGNSLVTLYRSNAIDNTPFVMQGWKLPSGELQWTKELSVPGWTAQYKLSLSTGGKRLALYPFPMGASKETITNIRFWDIVQEQAGAITIRERDQALAIKGLCIRCVAFHPNDKELILTADEPKILRRPPVGPPQREPNGLLMVYHQESMQEERRFETELINAMSCLEFNRTGSLLAGYDRGGLDQVAVWETTGWKLVAQAKRSYERWGRWPDIKDIRFTDAGKLQCAIVVNGLAGRWLLDLHPRGQVVDPPLPEITSLRSHSQDISSFAFSSDDSLLYSIDEGSLLCTWDMKNFQMKKSEGIYYPHKYFIMRPGGMMPTLRWSSLKPTLSPDGTWLVRNGMGVHLLLTNLQTGEHRKLSLKIDEKPQLNITLHAGFSPDGTILVADWIDDKRYVRAWETKTGKELWTNASLTPVSIPPVFSPDGKRVIVFGGILETQNGDLVKAIAGVGSRVRSFFSPDGRRIASQEGFGIQVLDGSSTKVHSTWTLLELLEKNNGMQLLNYPNDARTVFASVWRNEQPDGLTCQVQWIELASQQARLMYAIERNRQHTLHTLSHKGVWLAATNQAHGIYLWNLIPPQLPLNKPLSEQQMSRHWEVLSELPAQAAWQSMQAMISDPVNTVHFLNERLQFYSVHQRATELIADLDHKDFVRREQAGKELQSMGKDSEPYLQEAAKSNSLERSRRAKKLLQNLSTIDRQQLRRIRAIEVLERIGTAEARKILGRLATGSEVDEIVRQARQSLQVLQSNK